MRRVEWERPQRSLLEAAGVVARGQDSCHRGAYGLIDGLRRVMLSVPWQTLKRPLWYYGGANVPKITDLQAGDVVFVAWIDLNGNCRDERVRVQDTHQSHEGVYVIDLSTDSGSVQLLQLPPALCIAIDERNDRPLLDADGDLLVSPVLGIERDAGPFLLHVLFRVLEMGYSPADAFDLIAVEFELYPAAPYAALRVVPEEELRAHVDELVSDMAPSTGL